MAGDLTMKPTTPNRKKGYVVKYDTFKRNLMLVCHNGTLMGVFANGEPFTHIDDVHPSFRIACVMMNSELANKSWGKFSGSTTPRFKTFQLTEDEFLRHIVMDSI
jgi:hypothetical protein